MPAYTRALAHEVRWVGRWGRASRGAGEPTHSDREESLHAAPGTWRASAAVAQTSRVDQASEMGETMMTGLRLLRMGVTRQRFMERFGEGLAETYAAQLSEVKGLELLECDEVGVRLSRRGWLLGNWVFREFG